MVSRFLIWLFSYSESIVKPVDSSLKFLTWLGIAFASGIAFATALLVLGPTDYPEAQGAATRQCSLAAQIDKIQASYDAQIQPMVARWVQATKETSRTDLLPTQLEVKKQSEAAIRAEIERVQHKHADLLASLERSCLQN